jgi:transposase
LSRGGKARTLEAEKADDHDNYWTDLLVPFGILNVQEDNLSIYVGKSAETSDFIMDCLQLWWNENRGKYQHIQELVIDLDGGSATRSNRTQFMKRMVQFVQQNNLKVRLIYYPPYHSKYNPIERCWAVLENNWNGAILDSVEKALEWASTMTWKGKRPQVKLIDKSYSKGVKVFGEELEELKQWWKRSELLPSWDVTINPF